MSDPPQLQSGLNGHLGLRQTAGIGGITFDSPVGCKSAEGVVSVVIDDKHSSPSAHWILAGQSSLQPAWGGAVGVGVLLGKVSFSFNNFIESIRMISPRLMPLLNSILIASIIRGLKTGILIVYSMKLELILPVIGRGCDQYGELMVLKWTLKVKKGGGYGVQGRKSQVGATLPTYVPSGQTLTSEIQAPVSLTPEGNIVCSGKFNIWISSLVNGITGGKVG